MKKTIEVILFLCCSFFSYAQVDSTKKAENNITSPEYHFRPYAEVGMNFILNTQARQNYQTNSLFYWGLGVRLGNPDFNKLNFLIGYTASGSSIEQRYNNTNLMADSTLKIRQCQLGFIVPLVTGKDVCLRSKVAYVHSWIKDSYYYQNNMGGRYEDTSEEGNGLLLSLGLDKKVARHSKVYIEVSYDFMRLSGKTYSLYGNNQAKSYETFNSARLTIGFTL